MTEQATPDAQAAQETTAAEQTTIEQSGTADVTPDHADAPQEQAPTQEVDDSQIKALRKEAAGYRTRLREAEKQSEAQAAKFEHLMETLSKLTGADADEATPEEQLKQLTAERDAAQQQIRELKVTHSVGAEARKVGLNPDLVMPLIRGMGHMDSLDPDAEDYGDQLSRIVTDLAETYPNLRTQTVPKVSGQPQDNPPATPLITASDLDTMTAEQIYAAQQAGKLDHLFKR